MDNANASMGEPLSEAERARRLTEIRAHFKAANVDAPLDAPMKERTARVSAGIGLMSSGREYTEVLLAHIDVLEGQLATARERHVRERRYTDGDSEGSWGVAEECAADLDIPLEAVQHFDICKHCGDMETHDDELREYRDSLWPCPDARALGLDGGGSDST